LTKTIINTAIPLILQPKLEKARLNSFELLAHLEGKSLESDISREHYARIIQNSIGVDKKLAKITSDMPMDQLDKELSTLETDTVQLTIQSPYTLLMMRVVEIGLPILLSIFSIFFVLRYTLTEKRSHEIKDMLKLRNAELAKEEKNGKEPTA
jgi:flagellar biosynthesis/type III secretory pathway M-ring protein FliF/YscJ